MKVLKTLIFTVLLLILSIIFYGLVAFVLLFFPKNFSNDHQQKTQTLYLYHNTMHSDIILDLNTVKLPWDKLLPQTIRGRTQGYISFGWGDKETYLSTPTWKEIAPSVALKALFTNTPSVIHVSYYRRLHNDHIHLKRIKITPQQYSQLEQSLRRSFGESPQYIAMAYGTNDALYHSSESYNFINTCNTWTGDRLRESNISMSYWTPLSYHVTKSLE